MGFNAIRVFIEWGLVQPDSPNSINTAYFTQASGASPTIGAGLDYVVNWASALGMYVVICPAWTPSWIPPLWATTLSGSTGLTSGGLNTPVDMLYNAGVQSGIFYMYNWMAQHYSSNSNVIFESFNEISTTTDSDATAFAAFNNGWISAIESGEGVNSHLKIVELLCNGGDAYNYVLSTPYVSGTHANILLATHDYPLVDSTSDVALDFAQTWSSAIHSQNLPWIDTEYSTAGNNDQSPPGYTGVSNAISLMTQYNAVGWGYFCYDSSSSKEGNWNINNPTNSASLLPLLQPAMIQP
jgi:hypothetical protein